MMAQSTDDYNMLPGLNELITWSLNIIQIDPNIAFSMASTQQQLKMHGCVLSIVAIDALWPLLLTWFNFNPSMDR